MAGTLSVCTARLRRVRNPLAQLKRSGFSLFVGNAGQRCGERLPHFHEVELIPINFTASAFSNSSSNSPIELLTCSGLQCCLQRRHQRAQVNVVRSDKYFLTCKNRMHFDANGLIMTMENSDILLFLRLHHSFLTEIVIQ